MRRSARFLAPIVAILLVAAVPAPSRAGGSITWTYPGCAAQQGGAHEDTLQNCIDGATAGDTIQLEGNNLTSDFGAVSKSLTLKPYPGFHPELIGLDFYDASPASPAMNVTVTGVSVVEYFEASQGVAGDSLLLSHVGVKQQPSTSGPGITDEITAAATFEVIDSHVAFDNEWAGIDAASMGSGAATVRLIGNTITGKGSTYAGSGIELDATGSSVLNADVMNNSIWDVANCNCGGASGMFLYPQDTSTSIVNVVGNSFDKVYSAGIGVRNALTAGGHFTLNAFDNIFSHAQEGLDMDDSGGTAALASLNAGYNDFFKNKFGNFIGSRSIGTHNITSDPRFVARSTGNLRLTPSSPAINAGLVCTPGGLAQGDAAGHARLEGSSVDMGAYEYGAGAPTGVVLVGTSGSDHLNGTAGADILCGYGGNDVLNGMGGNDYLDGGAGSDVITGGAGSDLLFGEAGNDTLCARDGIHGNDHLDGGPGTDSYRADPGDVRVSVEHTVASC